MPTKANRITDPRLLAAMKDPRLTAIEEAVRRCDKGGNRREQLINHRYAWPKYFVSLLDELKLFGATDDDIMAVGDALRDAAYVTVLVGSGEPDESVGDALSLEMVVEGEANRDAMKLLDGPDDIARLMQLERSLSREMTQTDRTRRVVVRERHRRERAR